MCEPITMAAIGGGMNIGGALINRTLEVKSAEAMAKSEQQAAYAEAQVQLAQLAEAESQAQTRAQMEDFERQRQALRERASVLVATGEAGLSGGGVERQLIANTIEEGMERGTIDANLELAMRGIGQKKGAVVAGALNRQKAANERAVQSVAPEWAWALNTVIGGVSGGISGASAGQAFSS